MCIRDSSDSREYLNNMHKNTDKRVSESRPVSYTHLDVYKRQM